MKQVLWFFLSLRFLNIGFASFLVVTTSASTCCTVHKKLTVLDDWCYCSSKLFFFLSRPSNELHGFNFGYLSLFRLILLFWLLIVSCFTHQFICNKSLASWSEVSTSVIYRGECPAVTQHCKRCCGGKSFRNQFIDSAFKKSEFIGRVFHCLTVPGKRKMQHMWIIIW